MTKKHKQFCDTTIRPRPPHFVLRPEPSDRPITRQDLHAVARQLGLDRDDRLTVTVAGDALQITLSPLAQAEDVLAAEALDAVICIRDEGPAYFADDVRTTCAGCGTRIRHRPHVPVRPKKLCPACGLGTEAGTEGR